MSKRRIERELASLNDNLLADLSPDERIQLFAATMAEGNDEKTRLLRETIPRRTYRGIDPAYQNKAITVTSLSQAATYGLHMSYLQYQLANERSQRRLLESLFHSASAGEDVSGQDESIDDIRLIQRCRNETGTAAAGLYIEYHANRRFAEECLEVDLEQFLALSPPRWYSELDFGAAVAVLAESDEFPETVTDEEGTTMPVEERVQRRYDGLVRSWQEVDKESE